VIDTIENAEDFSETFMLRIPCNPEIREADRFEIHGNAHAISGWKV
jgi:hypothetical protein